MQAEYYSDKSIAVYGDTKPWASNLRSLGGKFNGNLRGRPGWIFPRSRESELMQFIDQVNSGQVAAPSQPTMVPFGSTQSGMTPQASMMRLQLAQPFQQSVQPLAPFPQQSVQPLAPFPQQQVQPLSPYHQQSAQTSPSYQQQIQAPSFYPQQSMAPQQSMVPQQPMIPQQSMAPQQSMVPPQQTSPSPQLPIRRLEPEPVEVHQQQAAAVNYPNLFTAADGLQYQIVLYTTPAPSVGQNVSLIIGDNVSDHTVSVIESASYPIDSILLSSTQETDSDGEPIVSRAVIVSGEWKIQGMQDDHTLTFHPLE